MIYTEHIETYGWDAAIRGMRNPKNSWDRMDSSFEYWDDEGCRYVPMLELGENDLKLAKTLANAGTDHGKFLRMITVSMDITAPLYWWKEYDTYKVGTVANSCSTMHKIADKEFTLDDFSHERLLKSSLNNLKATIKLLNVWRNGYLAKDEERYIVLNSNGVLNDMTFVPTKNECWWQMIQLLPSSYNQKRTVMLNYAVLHNIYHSRKNHKLDEWIQFCEAIKELPYSELITGEE